MENIMTDETPTFLWTTVPKKKRFFDPGDLVISITKPGLLYFPKSFLSQTGFRNCWVKIFCDYNRKTIGMKFYDKNTQDKELRRLSSPKGSALISVLPLLRALGLDGKLFSGVRVKEIEDSVYGKMYIFKLSLKIKEQLKTE